MKRAFVLPFALALGFALALIPSATAEPHACGYAPAAYACAGGAVEGDCSSQGYAYDEVMVVTLAGYAVVRGDSLCYSENGGSTTYEDDLVTVGAGTEVASASVQWYRFRAHDEFNGDWEGCRTFLRVYSIVGPLVIENMDCPAGQDPPNPGWGRLLP